jgi:hypothetical protein
MTASLMVTAGLYAVGGNVYLSTITDSDTGNFQSRSLLTFNNDGTLIISDSKQQGGSFSPFGTQHGYWEKDGETLKIKLFNFTYPKYFTCDHPNGSCNCDDLCCVDCEDSQQIASLTGKLKKNHDGKWEGPLFLTFFDLRVNNINDKHQGPSPSPAGNIILDYIFKP